DGLLVPIGYEELGLFFMLLAFNSGPVVFAPTPDFRFYAEAETTSWTKPALPIRFTMINLCGAGGTGAGGGKTTTSGNQAAGGGGGGGGGFIGRIVVTNTLSTGNVVVPGDTNGGASVAG